MIDGFKKGKFINSASVLTIILVFLSIIWYSLEFAHAVDKRISLLESHLMGVEQDISQIKQALSQTTEATVRLEGKIDIMLQEYYANTRPRKAVS